LNWLLTIMKIFWWVLSIIRVVEFTLFITICKLVLASMIGKIVAGSMLVIIKLFLRAVLIILLITILLLTSQNVSIIVIVGFITHIIIWNLLNSETWLFSLLISSSITVLVIVVFIYIFLLGVSSPL